MMEVELEPRVKPLGYKVKAASRESPPSQKAAQILELDLRSHWSTGTNTKEWILLELDEPCLLSHIRIYNKSVLEWEIAVGLRFKPETFTRVRPRCEAPRREMIYHINYTPCRYVRISCLRGNPIAIFFIQLIGVPVTGLEPEFQPVVSHLLPQIVAHKQDIHDMHLELLQDMTKKLVVFLPQLEVDLAGFTDDAEANLRFLAMLAGPLYPILHIVSERETTRSLSMSDSEVSKSLQPSALIVSSNFEPWRSRSTSSFSAAMGSTAFRPDAVFMLLRKAYRDTDLGTVCRTASRMLWRLIKPVVGQQTFTSTTSETSNEDETAKPVSINSFPLVDYSSLFGEEFHIPDDEWDSSYFNILDVRAVEEGILHVLYACASQPMLCHKLAENSSEFWSALPLVQALLPALRPSGSNVDRFDESFSAWKQPYIQQALSQIVMTTSSSVFRPLLHSTAGYLSSFSQSHVKAACVLIDLCSSVLAPWMTNVNAKVDLAVELLEDLLGTIQSASHSLSHARAALKYILLAISGHMDDLLGKYKEVKLRILFLLEMLEPFLDPAIAKFKSSIAFGDVSSRFPGMEHNCEIALNVIRTAIRKSAVLPSLEYEWRRGTVAPRVLLSILEPRMQLPPEIDLRKSPTCHMIQEKSSSALSFPSARHGSVSLKSSCEEPDGKMDISDALVKMENFEDACSFFAPPEVRNISLTVGPSIQDERHLDAELVDARAEQNLVSHKSTTDHFQTTLALDDGFGAEFFNLQADYFQLANFGECELRASEFQLLASDLHSQHDISVESHDAAVDALLLAAECYINPFFMMSSRASRKILSHKDMSKIKVDQTNDALVPRKILSNSSNLENMTHLEKKRDKVVLQLLLEAAQLDRNYWEKLSDGELGSYYSGLSDGGVIELSPADVQSTDAITLVRQNQALLCKFLIRQLQREQHLMHEVLMQSLLFLLESATTLSCEPGNVIDIILRSAECLNGMIMSSHHSREWNSQLNPEGLHQVQRHWILLQKLIIASSGSDQHSELKYSHTSGFHVSTLVPFSAWIQRISTFSVSAAPLARFLGWMAVSRYARQYMKDRVFLASELSQLTCLLSIFADDLSTVSKVVNWKVDDTSISDFQVSQESTSTKGHRGGGQSWYQSFNTLYPDLCRLFPNMKRQFESFGETILEAVALQLRSLPSTVLPDILCWFSDSCLSPFCRKDSSISQICSSSLKGHVGKNAKAIILYVLEAIVVEHMEAMVHEIPRLVHVLVSLCRAAYCDVLFLDSVMRLLNPILSYSMQKFSDEALLADDLCLNFESLCFDELFTEISEASGDGDRSSDRLCRRPLIIFVLATLLPNMSIQRRRDTLCSLLVWFDFTASESTASFHDYLCAFQCMLDSCKLLLFQTLSKSQALPLQLSKSIASGTTSSYDDSSKSDTRFLNDILCGELPTGAAENVGANALALDKKINNLSTEEIKEFTRHLERLIEKLLLTVERCWMLHHQLTKKLVISAAECFIYSRCLSSLTENSHHCEYEDGADLKTFKSVDQLLAHWRVGVQGLGEVLSMILQNHYWVVASLMLDCLLAVPTGFPLNAIIGDICSAIMTFSLSAPKTSWRLQADKWLSIFFTRGFYSFHEIEAPIVELFSMMLTHHEPEQRLIALKHLGKLVGQDVGGDAVVVFSSTCNKLISPMTLSAIPESVLSVLVSSAWDYVTLMASSDTSSLLRTRAMALLVDFIPFAKRDQLQSFLACSDTVVHGLGRFTHPPFDGPLFQLSLALIAGACLYSLEEDISLIPENVWMKIETLGSPNNESRMGDLEWRTCQVLCRLRNKPGEEKEALREALSSSTIKQSDPDFGNTREAILQVLANLTSAQSYIDAFSGETENLTDQEVEMELEVIQNEYASQPVKASKESHQLASPAVPPEDESRIKQIKDHIVSIERSRLREEIVARRQRKLVMRHNRQKFLEEAALREAELLQELDRERVTEVEKEIERQRLLEIERAKTRELQLNLDLERERQAQRELQREIEQIESGRSLRREIPSSSQTSRSRDRYREREGSRSSTELSGRATEPPTLARSYSGQPPMILQSRERADEYGSGYDENLDGSKDSGDANSVGDAELMSAFEGQSAQRHSGSRGSKSRQARERERESRREGKWERKHP